MPKTIKLEIKSRWFVDRVLFTYESTDNDIKTTLLKAVESGADLRGADLQGADLQDADLQDADLQGAKNAEAAIAMTVVPSEGAIIGWKKCADNRIVKLRIPEEAKRLNATGRKCRAEYAEVLAIYPKGVKQALAKKETAKSNQDNSFIYKVGKTVKPTKAFDLDRWNECSTGIHFFITREEAESY